MSEIFFKRYVEPAYAEWKENSGDIRLSNIFASELNNIAEHYWHTVHESDPDKVFHQKSVGKYRESLSQHSPSHGLIRDVADSHKHLSLNRNSSSLKSDEQVSVARIGDGQAYGLCYGGGETIKLELENGGTVYFYVVAMEVYEYWKRIFA